MKDQSQDELESLMILQERIRPMQTKHASKLQAFTVVDVWLYVYFVQSCYFLSLDCCCACPDVPYSLSGWANLTCVLT